MEDFRDLRPCVVVAATGLWCWGAWGPLRRVRGVEPSWLSAQAALSRPVHVGVGTPRLGRLLSCMAMAVVPQLSACDVSLLQASLKGDAALLRVSGLSCPWSAARLAAQGAHRGEDLGDVADLAIPLPDDDRRASPGGRPTRFRTGTRRGAEYARHCLWRGGALHCRLLFALAACRHCACVIDIIPHAEACIIAATSRVSHISPLMAQPSGCADSTFMDGHRLSAQWRSEIVERSSYLFHLHGSRWLVSYARGTLGGIGRPTSKGDVHCGAPQKGGLGAPSAARVPALLVIFGR